MQKLLPLILLMAFTGKKPAPIEVVPTPIKQVVDYAKETYPVKGWDSRYSEVIKLLEKEFPITVPCGTEPFLKAVINAESSFNNASYYKEPAPLNVYSIGLFQLSFHDAANYGIKDFLKAEKDLENPVKNIYLAMLIMNRLQTKYPAENSWESLGRYWSTLRDDKYPKWKGKNQSGVKRVKKYLSECGCII
jgi:hypothetical protein